MADASPSRSRRHPSGCSVPPQVTPRERVGHKSGAFRLARAVATPASAPGHWRSGLLAPIGHPSLPRDAPLSGRGHCSTPSSSLFTSLRVSGRPPPSPNSLLPLRAHLRGREPIRSSFMSGTRAGNRHSLGEPFLRPPVPHREPPWSQYTLLPQRSGLARFTSLKRTLPWRETSSPQTLLSPSLFSPAILLLRIPLFPSSVFYFED